MSRSWLTEMSLSLDSLIAYLEQDSQPLSFDVFPSVWQNFLADLLAVDKCIVDDNADGEEPHVQRYPIRPYYTTIYLRVHEIIASKSMTAIQDDDTLQPVLLDGFEESIDYSVFKQLHTIEWTTLTTWRCLMVELGYRGVLALLGITQTYGSLTALSSPTVMSVTSLKSDISKLPTALHGVLHSHLCYLHLSHIQAPPCLHALINAFTRKHQPMIESCLLTVGARAYAKHFHRDASGWWSKIPDERDNGSDVDLENVDYDSVEMKGNTSARSSGASISANVEMKGSESYKNEQALKKIKQILRSCVWINMHMLPHNVRTLEVRTHEGYGARWSIHDNDDNDDNDNGKRNTGNETRYIFREKSYTFRGFLEPVQASSFEEKWRH